MLRTVSSSASLISLSDLNTLKRHATISRHPRSMQHWSPLKNLCLAQHAIDVSLIRNCATEIRRRADDMLDNHSTAHETINHRAAFKHNPAAIDRTLLLCAISAPREKSRHASSITGFSGAAC
eukprot:GHVR01046886.1.p1 GENE.GHVR01046886.1~~GHVR01046886.1.p1  ORF type:complete len:123 (+),score=1.22 GHVR01046886.1:401-769(+)